MRMAGHDAANDELAQRRRCRDTETPCRPLSCREVGWLSCGGCSRLSPASWLHLTSLWTTQALAMPTVIFIRRILAANIFARSAFRLCLQRYGISRLPGVTGDKPKRSTFLPLGGIKRYEYICKTRKIRSRVIHPESDPPDAGTEDLSS